MHKSFEELCALAATGQITGSAMKILDEHVKDCSSCRAFLDDLISLKAHVTPVVAGSHSHSCAPPDGIRERFLQRAALAGLYLRPGPPIDIPSRADTAIPPQQFRLMNALAAVWDSVHVWCESVPKFAVPVAVGVLCGVLGFVVAERGGEPVASLSASPNQSTSPPVVKVVQIQPDARLAAAQKESAAANKRIAAMSSELAAVQAQKREIEQQLKRLAERAAAGERFEQQFKDASAQLEKTAAQIEKLQIDVETETKRAAVAEAVSLAQQRATEEANSKISSLQSQLQRLHETDSGTGMAADLISARNLHIVDVYDTESNGERKRAFGRVFFVEGKSLVFYAYDLPSSIHKSRKVEFHVWGEQAGLNSVRVNLGVMHADNPAEARWVLTCNDSKLLNRINAVFITADPAARRASQPRGGKLMYAFLGSPNHP